MFGKTGMAALLVEREREFIWGNAQAKKNRYSQRAPMPIANQRWKYCMLKVVLQQITWHQIIIFNVCFFLLLPSLLLLFLSCCYTWNAFEIFSLPNHQIGENCVSSHLKCNCTHFNFLRNDFMQWTQILCMCLCVQFFFLILIYIYNV